MFLFLVGTLLVRQSEALNFWPAPGSGPPASSSTLTFTFVKHSDGQFGRREEGNDENKRTIRGGEENISEHQNKTTPT